MSRTLPKKEDPELNEKLDEWRKLSKDVALKQAAIRASEEIDEKKAELEDLILSQIAGNDKILEDDLLIETLDNSKA